MICPCCYGPSRISKTLDTGTDVTRIHECLSPECDSVWATDQKLRAGSLRKNRRAIRRHGQATYDISGGTAPPSAVTNPSASANGHENAGGVGGGLPGGSDLFVLSPSDPPRQSDQEESRARGTEYPSEFLSAWALTAKTGSKFKAFEAWKRHGRPTASVVAEGWRSWQQLDSWRRGFVPHVVTWINGRCWEQVPSEAPGGQLVPEKAQQSRAGVGAWLAEQKGVTG